MCDHNRDLTIERILGDELVRLVMVSDGIGEAEMRHVLEQAVTAIIRRNRGVSVAGKQGLAGSFTSEDRSFGMRRTEVQCSQCGGRLGYVFRDGPPPTGLRYRMNGLAQSFTPRRA
jgi:SelR domain